MFTIAATSWDWILTNADGIALAVAILTAAAGLVEYFVLRPIKERAAEHAHKQERERDLQNFDTQLRAFQAANDTHMAKLDQQGVLLAAQVAALRDSASNSTPESLFVTCDTEYHAGRPVLVALIKNTGARTVSVVDVQLRIAEGGSRRPKWFVRDFEDPTLATSSNEALAWSTAQFSIGINQTVKAFFAERDADTSHPTVGRIVAPNYFKDDSTRRQFEYSKDVLVVTALQKEFPSIDNTPLGRFKVKMLEWIKEAEVAEYSPKQPRSTIATGGLHHHNH